MNWTFSPGDEMAETIAVGLPSWALLPPQNRHLKRWNLPEKLSGWTGGFHEKLIGLWFGRSWFGRICRKFCRGSMSFCFAHKHSMILWWFHAVESSIPDLGKSFWSTWSTYLGCEAQRDSCMTNLCVRYSSKTLNDSQVDCLSWHLQNRKWGSSWCRFSDLN